jgi:hypothetical protein
MGDMFSRIIGFPEDLWVETKGIARVLFAYLGFVESLGNTLIDMIAMLIIANGIDLHMECYDRTPRIRHVKSMVDLRKVPLSTKLNFLRDNGIKEIHSIIDNKLRNDIAHLNFKIDEENIYIRGQPAQQQLVEGLKKLNAVFVAYDELLRIDKIMQKKPNEKLNLA